MDIGPYATFALAFLVFAASPGPDNVTIVSKTVNDGPAHGLAYAGGMVTSIVGFVILAAFGFDALAEAAGEHLRFVRDLGAAYLIVMGISMWRAPAAVKPRSVRGGFARLYATGFLLNVSNPKMPIFYLALLPGVLGTRSLTISATLSILAVILAVEVLVVGAHVLVAVRTRTALARPHSVRALNRGAGALMIGAGALVAVR